MTKEWKLPAPEVNNWKPLVRVGRVIPFGYCQDPTDPDILLPVPKELELLEEAKKHIKKYSYRNVAAWLSEQSGRYISHVGLYKRIQSESKRKREVTIQKQLAERYKAAMEKAEKLDQRLGGGAARESGDRAGDLDPPGTGSDLQAQSGSADGVSCCD